MNQKANNTKIKPADFVHLHNHSHYSLLDGLQKVPEMLARAKELGMEAIGLTDHGTLSGTIELYKEAKKLDMKPIIGLEAYLARRSHKDKVGKQDANPYHLTVLAMDNTGYENLMRLSTIASLEGFYYKPRIDRELLEKYSQGLIVLSGCINGELGQALASGQTKQAEEIAGWYKEVFGDRYYLELQDHGHMWETQDKVNKLLLKLSQKLNIPAVVTADAHYSLPTDQNAHEVLLCVQTGSLLSDEQRMSLKDMDLFLSDPREIAKRWGANPELLTNTKKIADRCEVKIEFGNLLIPQFPIPKGQKEHQYLEQLAFQGLAWRYGGKSRKESAKLKVAQVVKLVDEEKVRRLQYELETVASLNLSSYFLIVADFINWAKDQGIVVGPGRGSAAGSIVSYALNITDLDPLEHDLLFERFLNPDRISMPDIDIDFQDDRRDEVIQYVVDKYGADRVAHIVTFGTMAARNAIRDTSRVLGLPYADADRLAKMVPPPVQGRHTPLSKHIQKVPELKHEYQNNARAKEVIDLAIRLEGTIRSHGVHAAGVVIAPDEIVKFTPLEMAQKGVVATQYSMNPIEDLGLLKMDFLGLSNLTIVKNALRIIRKVHKKEIDISKLPMDDAKTFKLLAKGETTGVFQLESAGMKRYIKQLKPNRFEDIVAMVALYRPGPMQFIDDFIARKKGKQEVRYMHPQMENALKETYGTLVYQEQVMQMAKDLCGFTGGEADTLRKAIGKKIPSLLAQMRDQFIEGGIKNSKVDKKDMEKLWQQLEDFAAYCFNKSHAASYAMISYWTAYLKAHYPTAFMAALMTSDHEDTDRIAIEIAECRQMGIEVLPPDVNESFVEFGIVPGKEAIRFSLSAIKNVGDGAAEKIVEAREDGGAFKSLEDFLKRVEPQVVNRKTLESLIKAGAFDSFAERGKLLNNLELIGLFANRLHKESSNGQVDLFGSSKEASLAPSLHLADTEQEVNEREKLGWERQLLGVYLSKHPLDDYQQYLKDNTSPLADMKADLEGQIVNIAGYVTDVRKIVTRNGATMAFVAIEDLTGNVELIVFPRSFQDNPELWQADKILLVKGKVSSKDREGHQTNEIKILVEEAKELDHESATNYQPAGDNEATQSRLVIKVPQSYDKAKLTEMRHLLRQHQGESEVLMIISGPSATRIKLPFRIKLSKELEGQLVALFDEQAIKVI